MDSTSLIAPLALTLMTIVLASPSPDLHRSDSLPAKPARLTIPGFPSLPVTHDVLHQAIVPHIIAGDPRNQALNKQITAAGKKIQNLNSSKHQYPLSNPHNATQVRKFNRKILNMQTQKNNLGIQKWHLAGEQHFGIMDLWRPTTPPRNRSASQRQSH